MKLQFQKILIITISILVPSFAFASDWQINEIMYNPKGSDAKHEWIEIKNIGGTILNVKGFYLFESETNHSIKLIDGDENIPAGGFLIICDDPSGFKSDFPNFSGNLFDATFSLGNDKGDTIEWRNTTKVMQDRVIYSPTTGASDNNATLSLFDGMWKEGARTPGDTNTYFINSGSNTDTSGSSGQTGSTSGATLGQTAAQTTVTSNSVSGSSSAPRKTNFEPYYSITSPAQDYVDAYQEYSLPLKIIYHTPDGSYQKTGGIININFGDGNFYEGELGKIPKHVYHRNGKYTIYISYKTSNLVEGNDIEKTIPILVGDTAQISYTIKEGVLELQNSTNHDIDIGEYELIINGIIKKIPKRTIVSASNLLSLEYLELGKITSNYIVLFKNKEGIAIPLSRTKEKLISGNLDSQKKELTKTAKKKKKKSTPAKAGSSLVVEASDEKNDKGITQGAKSISHILLGLLGISGILVYSMYTYLKRKKKEIGELLRKGSSEHELPYTIIDKSNNEGGFTIFELVMVLSIIGIFIALSSFYFVDYRNAAIDKDRISQARSMSISLEIYRKKCGVYPQNLTVSNPVCSPSVFELNNTNALIQQLVMYTPTGPNGKCVGYHIGIPLKRFENEANSDDDFDSRGKSCLTGGSGFTGIGFDASEEQSSPTWIYDVISKNESKNEFDQN